MVINAAEVSILVFCMAALSILLITNVFARTFFQSIYFAEEVSKFLVDTDHLHRRQLRRQESPAHPDGGPFSTPCPQKVEMVFIIFISLVSAVVMGIMAWFFPIDTWSMQWKWSI